MSIVDIGEIIFLIIVFSVGVIGFIKAIKS
jgi:hypothetical protein